MSIPNAAVIADRIAQPFSKSIQPDGVDSKVQVTYLTGTNLCTRSPANTSPV